MNMQAISEGAGDPRAMFLPDGRGINFDKLRRECCGNNDRERFAHFVAATMLSGCPTAEIARAANIPSDDVRMYAMEGLKLAVTGLDFEIESAERTIAEMRHLQDRARTRLAQLTRECGGDDVRGRVFMGPGSAG